MDSSPYRFDWANADAVDRRMVTAAMRKHGFVVADGFVPMDQLAEIEAHVRTFLVETVPTLPDGAVYFEEGTRHVRSATRLEEVDPFFDSFQRSHRLRDIVGACLGTTGESVHPQRVHYFDKPPHGQSEAPWHQDNAYQLYTPPDAVMAWVALDDVFEESGCLVYAARSHALGTVEHDRTIELGFSLAVKDPSCLAALVHVPVVVSRGALCIHHCNTAHRSGKNRTGAHRRALAINLRGATARMDHEALRRRYERT